MDGNNNPIVSVIVPLYNAEKYITETIESVVNQTYQNWELIVVDDCSTDNSIEIVKSFEKQDNRIHMIECERNFGGPARPRNIGIESAKGKYIAFLDADDVWLPNKLIEEIKVFNDNIHIDIVHSNANTIDENSNHIGTFNNQKTHRFLKYIMSDFNSLYISNHININTVLMKNNFNIKFREDKYLVALEDWAFWIDNMYERKQYYYINKTLINYRINIDSLSNRGSDILYRKAFYMYALLLNEKQISLQRYFFNSFFNLIKILVKKINNI